MTFVWRKSLTLANLFDCLGSSGSVECCGLMICVLADQEKEDKEEGRGSGERGGKQADRRIDIQPAEDEDGK